jgi:predicted transcriptional regulator
MGNIPAPMSKETLLALLDDIRAHVEANDSFEGYLEYAMPWDAEAGDPVTDGPEVEFRVKAGYRVGNLQGQGGFRMIGKIE